MKIPIFLIRMLLILPICSLPTVAQDYTQFSLPEDAIARLGKGTLGEVRFSPDGNLLAVSSSIGIWFYDPQTGKEVDLLVHKDGVSPFAFAFSPDGKTIAIGSTNEIMVVTGRREARIPSSKGNTVQLRDVATGEKKTTLRLGTQGVTFIAYSPDGKMIATAKKWGKTVYLWDAQTGEPQGTLERRVGRSGIRSFVYSPDGKTIATAGGWKDNIVQLWDAQTGAHKITLTGHKKRVNSVAYSPDGNIIVSGSEDGTVRLWDVATEKHKATMKHTSGLAFLLPWFYIPVNSVAYSPDGNTVAAASLDGKLRLWDVRTTKLKMTLIGNPSLVGDSIAYSPDGKTIATAGGWKDNTVRLWDAVTGEIKSTLTGYTRINAVAYSPDGKTVTTGGDYKNNSLQLWDVRTMELKITSTEHTKGTHSSIVYAPDGDTIAAVNLDDDTVRLWNAKTGKHKSTFKHTNTLHLVLTDREYDISSVAYSPDGNTIITGGGYYTHDEGTVYLWHARTGKRKTLYKGPDYVSALAYSPDGRTIATGNQKKKIQVWHTVTGEELKAISTGHRAGVESLVYSPDGSTIATTGGFQDNTVQLWDVTTGKHKTTLIGHTNTVTSVVYSPDGNTIASGSTDGTLRLWDATTEEHKATFTAHTDIAFVVYSSDGKRIATRSTDGTVLLWDITPASETE